MKNKTLKHMQKAQVPEHYDLATHAVITVDFALVEFLSSKMLTAKSMAACDPSFNALSFNRYDAEFIDFTANQADERCGMAEDEFEYSMDSMVGIILPERFEVDVDELARIDYMTLHVTSTEFWWAGYDKYAGADGHVETYRFSRHHLDEWNTHLGGAALVWHGALTWLGLKRAIEDMPLEQQSDNVTIKVENDEFIGVKSQMFIVTKHKDDPGGGILDDGANYLALLDGTEDSE